MLKVILIVKIVALAAFTANAQPTIINIETEGNLRSTNSILCGNISTMENTFTPADLVPAIYDCVNRAEYTNAAAMYFFLKGYGDFDQARVSDISARQAIPALLYQLTGGLNQEQIDAVNIEVAKLREPNSPEYSAFCTAINTIGRPDYFPAYMIQHGMGAVLGNDAEPLLADFNADEKWNQILESLQCR